MAHRFTCPRLPLSLMKVRSEASIPRPAFLALRTRPLRLKRPGFGSGELVNLNTATAGELESLPGIGPSKAAAIIENRPYATIDELERVPGIGAKTVAQLRDRVTAP